MISESFLKRKLQTESHRWRHELPTPYVKGIIKGLEIAVQLLKECGKGQRQMHEAYKGRMSRWAAAEFFATIQATKGMLCQGNRAKAIERLQDVIAKYEKEKVA